MTRYGIIACSKSKNGENNKDRQFRAENLYDSWLFNGRVSAVKNHCDEWCIMSAKHGHLAPSDKVSWYDLAIDSLPYEDRLDRANDVVDNIPPETEEVMVLMGRTYFEPLEEVLPESIDIWDPLEGVQLFDQRSKLKELADERNQQTLGEFS